MILCLPPPLPTGQPVIFPESGYPLRSSDPLSVAVMKRCYIQYIVFTGANCITRLPNSCRYFRSGETPDIVLFQIWYRGWRCPPALPASIDRCQNQVYITLAVWPIHHLIYYSLIAGFGMPVICRFDHSLWFGPDVLNANLSRQESI